MKKGFEITIDTQKKIIAAVDKGFVLITIDAYGAYITGGDDKLGLHLKWDKLSLNTGDNMIIKATVNQKEYPSADIDQELIDRKKLLKEYQELKAFLTEKRLLE